MIAQREKMVRLSTQAKNRLSSLLHRRHLVYSGKGSQYALDQKDWWLALPLTDLQKQIVQSDLETLEFARRQIETIEQDLKRETA